MKCPNTFRPLLQAGGSLIEVMVAIGLLTIFASTLFVYINSQLLASVGTQRSTEALALAREGIIASRAIRDTSWSLLATGTHGLLTSTSSWSFYGTSDVHDGFTRSISVNAISANEKQVISNVSWIDTMQQARTTTLATNLSNWRTATAITDETAPKLSGNWANPITLGTVDLGAGIAGTGVAVRRGVVYMTGTASQAAKPDFFVIDATNGLSPVLVTSLGISPGSNDVAVSGTLAFVANNDTSNQLSVINVSVTSTPQNIKNFTLTGNTAEALSIATTGTLVLIGTKLNAGNELYIVDISNPTVPLIKSTVKINGDINRISIYKDRAYLATTSSTKELMVVNIANPNSPFISAYANLAGTEPALGLYVNPQDKRIYVTRGYSAGASTEELYIFDNTDQDVLTIIGKKEESNAINSVYAADTLMFLGVNLANLEFQVFTITDPTNPAYYAGMNFPQVTNDMVFENNMLYVAVRSNDALRIITSQ